MLTLLLMSAQMAAVIEPDAARLAESEQCFTLYRKTEDGDAPIGNTWQTIERTEYDGRPALRIVVHQYGNGGSFDMRDEFIVDARNLKPLEFHNRFRNARGGAHEVDLRYTDERISGTRSDGGEKQTVDIPLDHAVWEGNLWGLTFAALPLAENAQFELPFWQYHKGFGYFDVKVTGEKTVTTPDGDVKAWVLSAGIKGDAHSEYFIAKDGNTELGYGGEGFHQALGGDCSHLQ